MTKTNKKRDSNFYNRFKNRKATKLAFKCIAIEYKIQLSLSELIFLFSTQDMNLSLTFTQKQHQIMAERKNIYYSRNYNQKALEFTAYITFIKYQFYSTLDNNQIDAKF